MSDNKMQFGVAGADDFKSDHAALLNALDDMQRSGAYALRHGVLRQAELLIVSQERAIADLRARLALSKERLGHAVANAVKYSAQLARQQAPVGDSVDELAKDCDYYMTSGERPPESFYRQVRSQLVNITAWKDAQLARERQGSGEPVRYENRMRGPSGHYGDWIACNKEFFDRFSAAPDIGDGFTYETRALYTTPAPQADEIRDGARLNWMAQHGAQLRSDPKDSRWYLVMPYHTGISCADDHLRFDTPREAIDVALRTTAADNQTKGE